MSYNKKSSQQKKPNGKAKYGPNLVLNNGTQVYEVQDTFSINSLIDVAFPQRKPIRGRHQELFNKLDKSIHFEQTNCHHSKLSYIGGTLQPIRISSSQNLQLCTKSSAGHNSLLCKDLELPLLKYQRLTRELSTFVRDLKQYLSASHSNTDNNNNNSDNNRKDEANVRLLMLGIEQMQAQLTIIQESTPQNVIHLHNEAADEEKENMQMLNTKNLTHLANINTQLFKSIHRMKDLDLSLDRDNDDAKQAQAQAQASQNKDSSANNVWSIYNSGTMVTTRGTCDQQFLNFESRIADLESCIGFVSDLKNPFPDLLNAVSFLEARYEYTFRGIWKSVKKQAERMSGDLKNIKYHLDLLQVRYKPNEKKTRLEWEQLEDLSRMMFKWDPTVFQLINIVQRLKCLAAYHYRSCLFINRVNTIYKQQCIIYESLKQDEQTLETCLSSIQENKELMKRNIAYVKQRLKRLEIRTKNK